MLFLNVTVGTSLHVGDRRVTLLEILRNTSGASVALRIGVNDDPDAQHLLRRSDRDGIQLPELIDLDPEHFMVIGKDTGDDHRHVVGISIDRAVPVNAWQRHWRETCRKRSA